ncbi:class I SAM-dependent methyltransferase [Ilyomonas limi]|uniref:Class I SAM-dependent methyltransferase n=1 Tax=Ilyomonas limi TaxID=2575867 RepID=A0A4U3L2Q4_9BACT|nr:class I SAM-dependent methyltransferase [Ilyomonas limi]TKK69391.1 class I SAM-dependent methyltransferase [Ilyomonas limi]
MDIQQAYNEWAKQYDSNSNKTRDLEAKALRNTLSAIPFDSCLEIGCGTGKNTVWFMEKASTVTAVDLSEEMLAKAREKVIKDNVTFIQADTTKPWHFTNKKYDLISFSLVLEHIENLDLIFSEAAKILNSGGYVYIGELHPFKQYTGSKARFDTASGVQVVQCYNHNLSDFVQAAKKSHLLVADINEYFDEDNRTALPRILTVLFKKS